MNIDIKARDILLPEYKESSAAISHSDDLFDELHNIKNDSPIYVSDSCQFLRDKINKELVSTLLIKFIDEFINKYDIDESGIYNVLIRLKELGANIDHSRKAILAKVLKSNDKIISKYLGRFYQDNLISERLYQRLLFGLNPVNKDLNTFNLGNEDLGGIDHINILSKLSLDAFYWSSYKKLFAKMSFGVRRILQRVLFISNGVVFKLDETMTPIDVDLNDMELSNSDLVELVKKLDVDNEKWFEVFNDFDLIPAINYFGRDENAADDSWDIDNFFKSEYKPTMEEESNAEDVLLDRTLDEISYFLKNKYLKTATFSSITYNNIFNIIIDEIDQPNLSWDIEKIGEVFQMMRQNFSQDQKRQIAGKCVSTIMQEDDIETRLDYINLLVNHHIINDKIGERLMAILKPNAYRLAPWEQSGINKNNFLPYMLSYHNMLWGEFKKNLARFPSVRGVMQRMLFKGMEVFKLDENLEPIDNEYNGVNMPDDCIVNALDRRYEFWTVEDGKAWAQVFDDYKIIPLINYFNPIKSVIKPKTASNNSFIKADKEVSPEDLEVIEYHLERFLDVLAPSDLEVLTNDFRDIMNFDQIANNLPDSFETELRIDNGASIKTKLSLFLGIFEQLEPLISEFYAKNLEKVFWKHLLIVLKKNDDTGHENSTLMSRINADIPVSFNKGILDRLTFRYQPGAKALTDNMGDEINHKQVISLLKKALGFIRYDEVKGWIARSTPAALKVFRSILFTTENRTIFMFDENMQPMDSNYDTLTLGRSSYIKPILSQLLVDEYKEELSKWFTIFNEFGIVSLYDYFSKIKVASSDRADRDYILEDRLNEDFADNKIGKQTMREDLDTVLQILLFKVPNILTEKGVRIVADLATIPFVRYLNWNPLIEQILKLIQASTINSPYSGEDFIRIYRSLQVHMNTAQKKAAERFFWQQMFNIKDSELLNYLAEDIPAGFNKKIMERLLFNIEPTSHKLWRSNRSEFKHTNVISVLNEAGQIPWFNLQKIIKNCSPAAKNTLQRIIFTAANKGEFILDETMQPIDYNYKMLDLNDIDLIYMNQDNNLLPEHLEEWFQVFSDLEKVPMFDYFDRS